MLRVIDGILYESKVSDEYTMRLRDLGGGHKEAVIRREDVWHEVKRMSPDEMECWERNAAEGEEQRREANRKRAARRAKTRVRHLVKVQGFDSLLTLTYKANQTDLELCKKHMKEFVRRIRRVLPTFTYVAAFEPQKRGAWHVHMATHRLPALLAACNGVKVKSFNVVRSIWRGVVGDLGGNIDQARRKRFAKQSIAKLAAYLSKYMLKAFEDGDDWSNRYSASMGVEVPKPVVMRWRGEQLVDLIALAFDEIASGPCECMAWLSPFGDTFFLSTEGPPVLH